MSDRRDSIELFGARTGNCLRVAIAFEEAGLPYRVTTIDLREGEQRNAAYLAFNPAGKVPIIVDHSAEPKLVLTQSNAILLYADYLKPGLLLPHSHIDRTITLERLFYFVTDVITVSHAAFMLRSTQSKKAVALLEARSAKALQSADRFVEKAPFMAGTHFSLADIAAYTIAAASWHHIDWEIAPNLARWFGETAERPSVKAGMSAFDLQSPNR